MITDEDIDTIVAKVGSEDIDYRVWRQVVTLCCFQGEARTAEIDEKMKELGESELKTLLSTLLLAVSISLNLEEDFRKKRKVE